MAVDTGQQMQQLYQRFGELPGVVIELHKELLAVQVAPSKLALDWLSPQLILDGEHTAI